MTRFPRYSGRVLPPPRSDDVLWLMHSDPRVEEVRGSAIVYIGVTRYTEIDTTLGPGGTFDDDPPEGTYLALFRGRTGLSTMGTLGCPVSAEDAHMVLHRRRRGDILPVALDGGVRALRRMLIERGVEQQW